MLGKVISTAGPNHMNYFDSWNFMAKFNQSSPLSNVLKQQCQKQQNTNQRLPMQIDVQLVQLPIV